MTFNPQPKPEKREKKKPQPIKAKGSQRYRTSTGELYTQAQIDVRLTKSYNNNPYPSESHCKCCHKNRAEDHDHTLSARRCKILKKTELIWDSDNWSLSCRECHMAYESYKSGQFTKHYNFIERMLFLKEHDPEGFNSRMIYVTDLEQITKLT